MPLLERLLDALVEFLVAPCCLDGPEVAAADDGGVLGIEVEGKVDFMEGAQVEVLRATGSAASSTRAYSIRYVPS